MKVYRKEITSIEHTTEGKAFADEYEKRLREQGAFRDRKEDTTLITITADFTFEIKGAEE